MIAAVAILCKQPNFADGNPRIVDGAEAEQRPCDQLVG